MIGIIGNGTVGSTLAKWFNGQALVCDCNPQRSLNPFSATLACDIVFICIYLPSNASTPEEMQTLHEYVCATRPGTIVVIKSTVMPGTCEKLQILSPDRYVLFNPEFLTEARPQADFEHPALQVVGGPRDQAIKVLGMLPVGKMNANPTTRQAEWLKLSIAGFLATKISWFNQLYDVLGDDFETVRAMIVADPRVGVSHSDVWQDEYRGWGGKCFTKDVPSMAQISRMPLMREVVEYNGKLVTMEVKA